MRGGSGRRIPLARPFLSEEIASAVLEVLESRTWTEGEATARLEGAVAAYVGAPHALAVTSCTTGLEVALRVLGVGPGDEVILPDFTHPATADAVALTGATIVLVDIDHRTMLMDYEAAEEAVTGRTRAIMPVSLFGNPVDYRRLEALRERHGLFIVEDAACALGSAFDGVRTGTQAHITVFSLHPRKFITTGEGGLMTTRNDEWADVMRSYTHFGAARPGSSGRGTFLRFGTNYKLSNILAAIGCGQMARIDELLQERKALAARYRGLLAGKEGIEIPEVTPLGEHSWQSFCVLVRERDRVIGEMAQAGIETQIGSYALHEHPAFREGEQVRHHGALRESANRAASSLALPLYNGLTGEEQELVVRVLLECIAGEGVRG